MKNISRFGQWFLGIGIIIQIITFWYAHETTLSLVSGIAGIFSVVLCAEKKISQYLFGFIQLGTYVILAYHEMFWGEIAENIFYVITMICGIIMWKRKYDVVKDEVFSKKLGVLQLTWVSLVFVVFVYGLWKILSLTNDTQPFLDSLSTVPAFIAQFLLIFRYREQWIFWLILNLASIPLWIEAENWCMVAQFIFWSINSLYGYLKWSK